MGGFPALEPRRFDPTIPSEARITDFWLGGKDNFAADREAAQTALEIAPELPLMSREGRRFLERTIRFLIEAGIRQFIDIGCGLPTRGNVHEVAHVTAPDTLIVYVDHDPVVIRHAQALVKGDPRIVVIQADARDPEQLLAHPDLVELIDLSQPVAILLMSTLVVIPDDKLVAAIVAHLCAAIAPGSYLAISHAVSDMRPETTAKLAALYQDNGTVIGPHRGQLRTRAEIEPLFDDLETVDPGLVYISDWRPDPDETRHPPETVWVVGGIGRKN